MLDRGNLRSRSVLGLLAALLVCLGIASAPSQANAGLQIDTPANGGAYQSPPTFTGTRSLNPFTVSTTTVHWSSPLPWRDCHPAVDCTYYDQDTRNYSDLEEATFEDDWGPFSMGPNTFYPAWVPYGVVTSAGVPDGHYYAEAHQQGVLGTDDETFVIQFDIDSVAPETVITAKPAQYSQDTTPVFEFTYSDPAPSSGPGTPKFKCSLDGATFSACSSGDEFDTPEGNHSLVVTSIDRAGNEDPTPATYNWMVDTTPPVLTINQPLSKGRYLLHEGPVADTDCDDPLSGGPPPVASGIATCDATPINDEDLGPHKFTLSSTDRAGNSSTKSVAYTIDPPDYGKFVKQSHPLAYYRFDETLGSDQMVDSSGNGNNGVYQNGIALRRDGATACERRPHPPRACELANPAENKAAYFPARDGHGYVNNMPAPQTAYTMEAWVKPRDGADMMVMSHGGGGQLFIKDGKLAFRQVQDTIQSNGIVEPGKWTHVAATWNGSTTRLYVNGSQVASSNSANKAPSGTSTFYVGYGEMAPWFHGEIDEAAYYATAVSSHLIHDRWKVGVAKDNPSVERGNSVLNTEGPFTDPQSPKNGGLYAPTKTPNADFSCSDVDDVPGDSDIASCTATVDTVPITNGDPLPDTLGPHTFTVTAVDEGGNTYVHHHLYTVKKFADLYKTDAPVLYCRLGDPSGGALIDSSGNGNDGEYKNDQDSGPVGISGDGDRARNFFGAGGYGYVNDVAAPRFQSTIEAWVNPKDGRNQSIAGHGDAGELFIKDGQFKYRRMGETVTSSAPVKIGVFQQVVGTWDGADIRIYVDGVETGKTESTRRPSSVSTFYVGFGELAPWFYGAIDEVAYYPVALNANRVYQHWLADPPPEELTTVSADDPTVDPEEPGDDPNRPVSDEPDDPGPGDPAVDQPSTDPGDGSAESGGPKVYKNAKAKKRRAAVKKCQKIKKKSKRKGCLKRARSI